MWWLIIIGGLAIMSHEAHLHNIEKRLKVIEASLDIEVDDDELE